MKILFLTKYPIQGASSRYRIFQYLPYYGHCGIEFDIQTFHTDKYVRSLSSSLLWKQKASVFRYLLSRIVERVKYIHANGRDFDLVVIERELFPMIPWWIERHILRFLPDYVIEYDDAIHIYYSQMLQPSILRVFFRNKVAELVKHARWVIMGNRYLEEYALSYNNCVTAVPSTVDTQRYNVKSNKVGGSDIPVIGWMGTEATAKMYLGVIAEVLQELALDFNFIFRVVGAPSYKLSGVTVEALPWALDREVQDIHGFDIGIMPLTDDLHAKGKCGVKLLQYMAAGVPSVASPVGVNEEIVQHDVNGLLAAKPEDWFSELQRLLTQPDLRERIGRKGYETVQQKYSMEANAPKLIDIFAKCVDKSGNK